MAVPRFDSLPSGHQVTFSAHAQRRCRERAISRREALRLLGHTLGRDWDPHRLEEGFRVEVRTPALVVVVAVGANAWHVLTVYRPEVDEPEC
ncbi:MAG TPA: hypothetical protein VEB59_12790 [Gemmatimonadales bacterium]|nr:hypothetical protein [Gemmatimonadales bacterium]